MTQQADAPGVSVGLVYLRRKVRRAFRQLGVLESQIRRVDEQMTELQGRREQLLKLYHLSNDHYLRAREDYLAVKQANDGTEDISDAEAVTPSEGEDESVDDALIAPAEVAEGPIAEGSVAGDSSVVTDSPAPEESNC